MQTQRRPYRSHKVPACDRCRRFKRRCTGGTPGRPCMLCGLQDVPCVVSPGPKTHSRSTRTSNRENQRQNRPENTPSATIPVEGNPAPPLAAQGDAGQANIGPAYHGSPGQDCSKIETSVVASPVISEDIQILERYMSKSTALSSVEEPPSHAVSSTPSVYLRVPRRREGLAISQNPGKQQKEIMMQILQPYTDELVRLYFEKWHPAFPILDEQSFMELYKSGDKLSPALTCEFFALSLILWQHSPMLRQFPKPNTQFIWNLAIEAMQHDFMAPGLSTVYSVVLDMMGRPALGVLMNTMNNGRAVCLAQSLGLNRDPTHWRRQKSEKALRIRLWWAVIINDRWSVFRPVIEFQLLTDTFRSSFAHGIPPTVARSQYDVPVPVLSDIFPTTDQVEHRMKAAESFIHLCTLTVILGEVLPLLYNLDTDQKDIWKKIRRMETDLDDWEDRLPEYLQPAFGDHPSVTGSSSLRLGYLSVRLLLNRIALHAAGLSNDLDRTENTRYHLSQLRKSAQEIASYVCALGQPQLQEFWLPYTSYHLILTVIILLRCIVESTDKAIVKSCKTSLRRFWTKLQNAAENEGWDLADICIAQCADSVSKILNNSVELRANQKNHPIDNPPPGQIDISPSAVPSLAPGIASDLVVPDILPFSNPDISFDNNWDFGSLYGLGWIDNGMDPDSAYEGLNQGLL
ncbi:hypothetical protein FE257_002556 [Aspergillus nanangensis]|uniref:Zn(2)-C6 fungal-type domain-containing protein n=1 Tax=Aspergillus nanangensis TaxID=2582783 RepID=A0AAD4GWY1_ASPNN|nr:hypothetical protein FE257_002556 [Aspergillus nanangensis]